MVSQAKAGGGIHLLYPGHDWHQAPWYLSVAVGHALQVLGFFDMPKKDRPPEEIWLRDEELRAHFETVERKYESGAADTQAVPMVQNELTRGLRD